MAVHFHRHELRAATLEVATQKRSRSYCRSVGRHRRCDCDSCNLARPQWFGKLKAIGAAAGAVPTAATSPSEWLHRQYDANIVNGLTPTSTPTSSTTGSIDVWVSGDQACQTSSFGSVDFASPAARSAWVGAGLSPDPVDPPPIGWCSSGSSTYYGQTHPGSTLESGVGVIDVSGLPTDPTTLADELSAGTTGIAGLDSAGTGPNDPNPGFTRAVLLLVVPTIGDSPSFQEALLNALALMPNIQSLGRVVTHTGETGDGFSAGAAAGSPAIILDPSTGVLLELRDSSSLMGLWTGLFLQTYLGTSQQGNEFTPQVIAELSPSIAWLDPIGPATSVASNDVPTLPNRIEF